MYTVLIKDKNGYFTTIVQHKDLSLLTNLLENNKVKFEVHSIIGKHSPSHFGFGGYKYWT